VHESERTPEYESDLEVDLMEEDDNGGQKNKKGKKSKANPNNAPVAAALPVVPLEPPPPFDPKTFKHQPIPAAHHPKMKAVSDSWDIPKGPLDLLAQLVRESAVLLTDAGEAADPTVRSRLLCNIVINSNVTCFCLISWWREQQTLRMLDKTMKEVVDMQNELNARKNAAMGLRQKLTHGEILVSSTPLFFPAGMTESFRQVDPVTTWDNAVQEDITKYQKKTARQKYANDKTYMEYREELWVGLSLLFRGTRGFLTSAMFHI